MDGSKLGHRLRCNECTKEHLYRITGSFDDVDDRLDKILDEWEELYGITPERGRPADATGCYWCGTTP